MGRNGFQTHLPIRVPITIGTMLNFDDNCDSDGHGVGTCKQTLQTESTSSFYQCFLFFRGASPYNETSEESVVKRKSRGPDSPAKVSPKGKRSRDATPDKDKRFRDATPDKDTPKKKVPKINLHQSCTNWENTSE